MKKIIFTILTIGFLIANKHYALTSVNIPFFNTPKGYVRIDFINKSNKKVTKITFNDRDITIKNVAINHRKTILLNNKSEGSYAYTVFYEDGKKITSNGAYIESGYFIKEYILNYTTRIDQTYL